MRIYFTFFCFFSIFIFNCAAFAENLAEFEQFHSGLGCKCVDPLRKYFNPPFATQSLGPGKNTVNELFQNFPIEQWGLLYGGRRGSAALPWRRKLDELQSFSNWIGCSDVFSGELDHFRHPNTFSNFGYSHDVPLPNFSPSSPSWDNFSPHSGEEFVYRPDYGYTKSDMSKIEETSNYRKFFASGINIDTLCQMLVGSDQFNGHLKALDCNNGTVSEKGALELKIVEEDARIYKYSLIILGQSSLLAMHLDKTIEKYSINMIFGFDMELVPRLFLSLESAEVRSGSSIEPILEDQFADVSHERDRFVHIFVDGLASSFTHELGKIIRKQSAGQH